MPLVAFSSSSDVPWPGLFGAPRSDFAVALLPPLPLPPPPPPLLLAGLSAEEADMDGRRGSWPTRLSGMRRALDAIRFDRPEVRPRFKASCNSSSLGAGKDALISTSTWLDSGKVLCAGMVGHCRTDGKSGQPPAHGRRRFGPGVRKSISVARLAIRQRPAVQSNQLKSRIRPCPEAMWSFDNPR